MNTKRAKNAIIDALRTADGRGELVAPNPEVSVEEAKKNAELRELSAVLTVLRGLITRLEESGTLPKTKDQIADYHAARERGEDPKLPKVFCEHDLPIGESAHLHVEMSLTSRKVVFHYDG